MDIRAGFLSLLMLICCPAVAATLDSLSIKHDREKTLLMCTFTGAFTHKVFTLSNPTRVVLDLNQTTTSINVQKLMLGDGVIAHVRSGHPNPKTLRLVLDMKRAVTIRTSAWNPANPKQKGLRIDLIAAGGSFPHHQVVAKKTKTQVQRAPSRPLRDVVIVLDPGHGGKDPGAIGPRRNAEKNVVLAIAIKLKKMIDSQPGMHAVLTRSGDYYVGLRERLTIARRSNADIFVSIHADAFINKQSSGASVFALSQTGATSEAARWLAEKENYSELGGVNLSGLDDQNGLIRTVLLDLSQTATISASLQMGNRVLRHMDKITSLHNSAVEQARFVVLKSPDIPSVLVETGFITNPREEKNLTNPGYQMQLTRAIFEGLKRYFWDYPPHGTRLEVMSGANLHIVRAHETLPMIAQRYHVTVAALKSANHLSGSTIQSGQKLSIPSSWA